MNARTSIMLKAVVNSKRLLTGACPETIHLAIKYPNWHTNPMIVINTAIDAQRFFFFRSEALLLMEPPKKKTAERYKRNAAYNKLPLNSAMKTPPYAGRLFFFL